MKMSGKETLIKSIIVRVSRNMHQMPFEKMHFLAQKAGGIAEECCKDGAEENCLTEKLIRFRAEEERAKAIGRIFCRRFRTMGEKVITQRAFVRVSQEVPSIKQEVAMKIAEEVAHKAEKCCQRHHAACLHDELHLVLDVICKHASELAPDAHRCCLIAGQGRLPCFDKLRPHREMGVFIPNPTLYLLCLYPDKANHQELENVVLFTVAKRFPRAAAHLVIHLAHDIVGIDKKCCYKRKDHDSHEEQQIDHYHAHHRHNGKHSHSHGDSHEHHNDSSHSHSHEHHQHGSHSHSHEHHNDSSHSHSHEHHQHGSHSHSHEHHDHHHKHGKSDEHEHFPHFEVDFFGHHIKHDECVVQEAHRAAEFMYAAERQERRICHSLKLSGRNHYHHKEIVLLSQHYPSLPFDVVEKFAHTFTHMVMRCCNPGGAFPWISHNQKHDETSLFPGCYEKKIFQFVDMMCAEKEFLDNVPDAITCCESSGFKRKHCLMSMEPEGGMTSHTHRPFPNSTAELFSRISCLYHDLEHHNHIDWVLWKLSHLMPGLGLSDILKLMLELQDDHEKCCHIPKSLECLTKQNEEFNTHIYSIYDNMDNECKELLEKKDHYHDKLLMEWARDIPNVPFSTLAHKIKTVLQHSKFACPKDHLPAIHHMKDHIKEMVCTLGGACCFTSGESHAHDEETHLETHLDKLLVNDVCHGALKHPQELRCRIITHVARKYPTQDLEHTVMYAESFVKSGEECCEKPEIKNCLQGHFNTTADVMKNLLSNLS
uniref:Albumin domain-containing protein n=1 Tax=Eptatretus burgeri TaxID=7764 RepID=A0A8C4QXX2_EPTBU